MEECYFSVEWEYHHEGHVLAGSEFHGFPRLGTLGLKFLGPQSTIGACLVHALGIKVTHLDL